MSTYAMSDLHGESELFFKALKDIDFDYKKDKLYILGDVIDRGKSAIKILKYIIENQNSIDMILGNHEEHFLRMLEAYDYVMLNDDIKQKVKILLENRIKDFDKIEAGVQATLLKGNKKWYEIKKYVQWSKVHYKRKRFLEDLQEFIEYINYNKDNYDKVDWILTNIYSQFYTKYFVKELLETSKEDYIKIRDYLKEKEQTLEFNLNGKNFYLQHGLFEKGMYGYIFARDKIRENNIILFGHIPFGSTIRDLILNFRIDLRKAVNPSILGYTDDINVYYNLDTSGTKGIGILQLDNLSQFYITEQKMIDKEKIILNRQISYSQSFKADYFNLIDGTISNEANYYIIFENNIMKTLLCVDDKNEKAYYVEMVNIKNYEINITQYCSNIEKIMEKIVNN